MIHNGVSEVGRLIKQRRVSVPMTLSELSESSGVSSSHLGRIERGERFPSARILKRIAKPLGFEEDELFMIAGFLSVPPKNDKDNNLSSPGKMDPLVANILAHEPVEIQRAMIGILSLLKSIAKTHQ